MPKIEVNSFVQLLMFLEGLKTNAPSSLLSLADLEALMDGAADYVAGLEERDDWLRCLEMAGIDSTTAYECAFDVQREYFPDRYYEEHPDYEEDPDTQEEPA